MWEVLERGLLSMFKFLYGDVPRYNKQGRGPRFAIDSIRFFRSRRLKNVIESLS